MAPPVTLAKSTLLSLLFVVATLMSLCTVRAQTDATLTLVHAFAPAPVGRNSDGIYPSRLVEAGDGNLYGTAQSGGEHGSGTVFELTPNGGFDLVHTFPFDDTTEDYTADGFPQNLVLGTDGNLYGVAAGSDFLGHTGTTFVVVPGGGEATVAEHGPYDFTYELPLFAGNDGFIYCVADVVNEASNTAFSNELVGITYGGGISMVYNFGSANNVQSLIQGADGVLYGVINQTLFSLSSGNLAALYTFGGTDPAKTVVAQGPDGSLYLYGNSTIYAFGPTGVLTTAPAFPSRIADLIGGTDGNLYGILGGGGTYGHGYVFMVTPDGTVTSLHSFTDDAAEAAVTSLGEPFDQYYLYLTQSTTGSVYIADHNHNYIFQLGPFINSDRSITAPAEREFSYQATATNDLTNFAAGGLPGGLSIDADSGLITGVPSLAGTYNVVLSATGSAGTAYATLVLTVTPTPPVIESDLTGEGTVGEPFSYQITADYNPISFDATKLPPGLSINKASGVISGVPTQAGTYQVGLYAYNVSAAGSASLTLVINPPAPVITSAATATGTVGKALGFRITATNNPTSIETSNLPPGLSPGSGGLISGTPTLAGTYAVTVVATNASGSDIQTLTFTIKPPVPVITSPSTASGTVGKALGFRITASNSPTSFEATNLPPGLTLGSGGLISGTPTTAGTYAVKVSATNSGGTGSATLTLTIKPLPPTITSALTAAGTVGKSFGFRITATNSPTSYAAANLPTGLSLGSGGLISGTPTTAGTYSVKVSATNASGTGLATLTFTIKPLAPVITSASAAKGTVGKALGFRITASNSPTSFAATNLPPGLTVGSTGLISGTPTTAGTYAVRVSATNAGGTGTGTLTFTITAQ